MKSFSSSFLLLSPPSHKIKRTLIVSAISVIVITWFAVFFFLALYPVDRISTDLDALHNLTLPFSFVVYGDSRSQNLVHRQVVSAIAARAPSAVFSTGDIVNDHSSGYDWQAFFNAVGPLTDFGTPYFSVLGDHECCDASDFLKYFALGSDSPTYRALYAAQNKVLFLLLDSTLESTENTSAQYSSLSRTLEDSVSKGTLWRFAFYHHPLWVSSGSGCNNVTKPFLPLFTQYNVTAVFSGHNELYERIFPMHGPHWFVTGGGGCDLDTSFAERQAIPSWSAAFAVVHHFINVQVDVDLINITTYQVLPALQIIDSLLIRKGEPFDWYGKNGSFSDAC